MKTAVFLTLVFACAVLVGCTGTSGSDSLSTTDSDLVSTSDGSPDGDVHTVVTRISDNAEVATLDWSEAGRTMVARERRAGHIRQGEETRSAPVPGCRARH